MKTLRLALLPVLIFSVQNVYSWDFGAKGDFQKAFTDNVNLTNTDPIKDNFSILSGYLQAKNEKWRLKLKGKVEKYSKQSENDNYTTDLGLQYKRTKNNDYTFSVFKQVYNGTPLVSTDTTSDNSGARLNANFSHDFKKNTQGYFTATGTIKNYSKIEGRKDKILGLALGLEHNFDKVFMIAPELSFQHNGSADSYYSSNSFGPNLLFSYSPDENWELFADGNYSHTTYSGRTVSKVVHNKTLTEKEYQELFTADAGAIYSFPQYTSLTAKYTNSHNTSNNTTSAYKASIFYLGFGLKF
jgi:hypothetical protein